MTLPLKERLTTLLMPSALYYRGASPTRQSGASTSWPCSTKSSRPAARPSMSGPTRAFFAFALSAIVDRVEAFEPNPDYADFARRMLGARAHVHAVALSNRNGRQEFVVPVSEEGTVLHLGGNLGQAGTQDARPMRFEVEVRTLDSYAFTAGSRRSRSTSRAARRRCWRARARPSCATGRP